LNSAVRNRIRLAVDSPRPDHAAWFTSEVLPHEPALRSWLQARFASVRDIDDVLQEAYLRVFRARAAGKIDHPKAYLFNTARNAALDRVRRERVVAFEPLTDSEGSFVLEGSADATSPDVDFELETLAAAIRTLPERCREVLILRKYHGLSHEEIAARLGITRNTVNAHITLAMLRCREYFRARGLLRKDRHDP
jgi:RNA polymerase sigma-70 factor (ECF subfamily)